MTGDGEAGVQDGGAGGSAGVRRSRRTAKGRRIVRVYLTEGEVAEVGARAAGAGLTMSRFLAESGLVADRRTVGERRALYAALQAAKRTVAGAAVNLNQLAKVANSTGQVPAEVTSAAVELVALAERLDVNAGRLVDTVMGEDLA